MDSEQENVRRQEAEKSELRMTIRDLNDGFADRKGFFERGNVYNKEVLEKIRQIPFPVVVDLNNVLANNELPLKLSPEAREFLRGLEEIDATPVIVTTTSVKYRERDIEFLRENDLWSEDIVFINEENYSPDYNLRPADADKIVNQFLENDFSKSLFTEMEVEDVYPKNLRQGLRKEDIDKEFIRKGLEASAAYKRLAPIFNKNWEIPIIDDFEMATNGNFGMKGFKVIPFESREKMSLEKSIADASGDQKLNLEQRLEKLSESERKGRYSLLEILEQIKDYKKSLGI